MCYASEACKRFYFTLFLVLETYREFSVSVIVFLAMSHALDKYRDFNVSVCVFLAMFHATEAHIFLDLSALKVTLGSLTFSGSRMSQVLRHIRQPYLLLL